MVSGGRRQAVRAGLIVSLGVVVSALWGVATDDLELAARWRWSVAGVATLGTAGWAVFEYLHSRDRRASSGAGEGGIRVEMEALVGLTVAVPVAPSVTTNNLPTDNRMFTDRDPELARVDELVSRAERAGSLRLLVAIDGMAGVGKTALAVRIAERLAPRFDKVLYQDLLGHTPGRHPANPETVLVDLLVGDGMAPSELPDDLERLASIWRSRTGATRILLVLDNALDEAQVEPLLPGAGAFVVLVTSRRRLSRLRGRYGAIILPLDCLPDGDAVTLFARVADRAVAPDDEPTVAALVQRCGGLPLAITLVASGLQPEPDRRFVDRLAELDDSEDRLAGIDETGDMVAAAFETSYRRLTREQQMVLRRLSLMPGSDVDVHGAAALTGLSVGAVRGQLQRLYGYRLLERARGRYRMHDLVREYARRSARCDPVADRVAAVGRLVELYQRVAVAAERPLARQVRPAATAVPTSFEEVFEGDRDAVAWMRAELPNLLACADQAASEGSHRWTVGLAAAVPALLRNDGHWRRSAELQRRAVAAAQALGDVQAEANALNEFGLLLRLQGNAREAVEPLRRALRLYRSCGSRLGEAHARNDLGVVLDQLGESRAAKEHLSQALGLYRELGDRLGEANVLHDLGVACRFAGDYPRAVELIRQALAGYREVGSVLGEAHALTYLAIAQRLTGDLSEAADHLEQARTHYRELRNRLGEANSVSELATVWRLTGQLERAGELLAESFELHRDLGNRRGEARARYEQGTVREAARDDRGARELLLQALALFRDQQNPRGEVEVLNSLGAVCRRLGQLDEARRLHERALGLSRTIESARDRAHALAGLGRVDLAEGRTVEAAGRLRSSLDILSRIGAVEAAEVAALLAACVPDE